MWNAWHLELLIHEFSRVNMFPGRKSGQIVFFSKVLLCLSGWVWALGPRRTRTQLWTSSNSEAGSVGLDINGIEDYI